jgi:integrase
MSSSHSHYRDYKDVRGDGRVILYRRADTRSNNWWVRLKVAGHPGYVTKSSKSTDDYEARRFAEDFYYQLEGKARRGEAINSPTFNRVFGEWKASLKLEQTLGSSKYIAGNIRRMEIWAIPNLGPRLIETIDDSAITDFLAWRLSTPASRPTISTLRNERTVLNQILRFAVSKGYIKHAPTIRLPASRQSTRPDIPDYEWKLLIKYLWRRVQDAPDHSRRRERFYLQQYIMILANSGIRIGEARSLRWRDISATSTVQGEPRVIFRVAGKTGEREVVCNKQVNLYVKKLREFRLAEIGRIHPDEPIFCHPDGLPIGSYQKGFETALRAANLLHGPEGKRRVPYSLRHTYATRRGARRSVRRGNRQRRESAD